MVIKIDKIQAVFVCVLLQGIMLGIGPVLCVRSGSKDKSRILFSSKIPEHIEVLHAVLIDPHLLPLTHIVRRAGIWNRFVCLYEAP